MSLAKNIGIAVGALAVLVGAYLIAKKQGWIGAQATTPAPPPPVSTPMVLGDIDPSKISGTPVTETPASTPVATTDAQAQIDAQIEELKKQQAASDKLAADLGVSVQTVSNIGNKYAYSQV